MGSGDLARHWAVCDWRRELLEGREEVLLRCYLLLRCRALPLHHSVFNKQLLGVSAPGAAHWGSGWGGQTLPLPRENPPSQHLFPTNYRPGKGWSSPGPFTFTFPKCRREGRRREGRRGESPEPPSLPPCTSYTWLWTRGTTQGQSDTSKR